MVCLLLTNALNFQSGIQTLQNQRKILIVGNRQTQHEQLLQDLQQTVIGLVERDVIINSHP
jgi:hypothetical protein